MNLYELFRCNLTVLPWAMTLNFEISKSRTLVSFSASTGQPLHILTHLMATLETLPLDLFTDSLLPFFSPSSLARLAATNRAFHDLIQGAPGEVVWAALIAKDYNFPVHNTGRRSGWRELYRRLAASTNCFVWGCVIHRRHRSSRTYS